MKPKFILLNNDGTIDTVKQKDSFSLDDVKYVAIPIIGYNTHILLKPKKLMKFKRATIVYTLSAIAMDHIGYSDDEDLMEAFETKTIVLDNIIDLYNLMHSLSRISYANQFYNNFFTDSKSTNMMLYISSMSVTLYDSKNKVIYEKSLEPDLDYDDIWFSAYPVVSEFKEIIKLCTKDVCGKDTILQIADNRWDITLRKNNNGIVGLPLSLSDSVMFLDPSQFKILNHVTNVEYSVVIYSAKEDIIEKITKQLSNHIYAISDISDFINDTLIANCEIWEDFGDILSVYRNKPEQFVELVTYLPQIYRSIFLMFQTYMCNDMIFDIIINLVFTLEKDGREYNFSIAGNGNNIQTLDVITAKIFSMLYAN